MQADKIHLASKDFTADMTSLVDSLRVINRRGYSRTMTLAPLLSRLEFANELTRRQQPA